MNDFDNDHREDDDLGVDVPSEAMDGFMETAVQSPELIEASDLLTEDTEGLLSRIRKISIVDAGATTIAIYLAVKGAVATVLGWQYADIMAEHAVDFQEYNQLVYAFTAGIGTVFSSASFWALMTMLGVRAVARKIINNQLQEDKGNF